jgi:hypothetical protein
VTAPGLTLALGGVGRLQASHLADVVVDDELSLQAVMRRGEWLPVST